MKLILQLFATCVILLSCKKESTCNCISAYEISYLKAQVLQASDISCYRPILDFSEDSLRIRQQTNLDWLLYTTVNLPSNYNVIGQKLYVSVTDLQPGEEFVCNTLGIPFPPLKIVDAKPRQ